MCRILYSYIMRGDRRIIFYLENQRSTTCAKKKQRRWELISSPNVHFSVKTRNIPWNISKLVWLRRKRRAAQESSFAEKINTLSGSFQKTQSRGDRWFINEIETSRFELSTQHTSLKWSNLYSIIIVMKMIHVSLHIISCITLNIVFSPRLIYLAKRYDDEAMRELCATGAKYRKQWKILSQILR